MVPMDAEMLCVSKRAQTVLDTLSASSTKRKMVRKLNEIDVLVLDGNVPTFIFCKRGKTGA